MKIGALELVVIFIVALLVIGPDKLPDLARSLAKGLAELRRSLNEVKGSFAEEERAVGDVGKESPIDLAGMLPDQINIKATTEEKLGFTGREEGIAAQAVAGLETI